MCYSIRNLHRSTAHEQGTSWARTEMKATSLITSHEAIRLCQFLATVIPSLMTSAGEDERHCQGYHRPAIARNASSAGAKSTVRSMGISLQLAKVISPSTDRTIRRTSRTGVERLR